MTIALDNLIDTLFSSILDNPPWLAFLEDLEQCLPCHHAALMLRRPRDGDIGVGIVSPIGSPALIAFQRKYYRDAPFIDLSDGHVHIVNEQELKRAHMHFFEFLRKFSAVTEMIALNLVDPSTGMIFRLRATRLEGEPGFGKHEKEMLESLIPRLRIAFGLYARNALLEYRLSILDETAGRVAVGSGVLDGGRRILIKNMVLDQVLQENDGFHERDGDLHCNDIKDNRALGALLRRCCARDSLSPEGQTIKVRREGGERFWSLFVRPLKPHPGLGEKIVSPVIVLLRDASNIPDINESILIEMLGFTRAEAALAVRLVKGFSLYDAATSLNISRTTARTQLASIFDRTGIRRQAQLVSFILSMMKTVWN